jgi:hypothetical protein
MNENESGGELVAALFIGVAVWFPLCLWQGYVAALLWGWFVTPLFAAPALTTWQAVGLMITLHHFAPTIESPRKRDGGSLAGHTFSRAVVLGGLAPAVALLSGWVVRGLA